MIFYNLGKIQLHLFIGGSINLISYNIISAKELNGNIIRCLDNQLLHIPCKGKRIRLLYNACHNCYAKIFFIPEKLKDKILTHCFHGRVPYMHILCCRIKYLVMSIFYGNCNRNCSHVKRICCGYRRKIRSICSICRVLILP